MIQTKLTVGPPGDRYEQEAEQIAEQVMRMPIPPIHEGTGNREDLRPHSVQPRAILQRDTQNPYAPEEGEGAVQAKGFPGSAPEVTPGTAARIMRVADGGHPLPQSVRLFMESRFGHEFSQVRVHSDVGAAEAARLVRARAFTLAEHLVFGAGEYAPTTESGLRLLAHELTHVIQQGKASRVAHGYLGGGDQRQASPRGDPDSLEASSSRAGEDALLPPEDVSNAAGNSNTIRRVAWSPNTPTGRFVYPWGSGPRGEVRGAATDAGTALDTWKPDDGTTYWCHGYTFGGSSARGGPYSFWGQDVPTVLRDDGWKRQGNSCVAQPGDILIFYDASGKEAHSGIVRSVSEPGGRVDEDQSTLQSKWGSAALNVKSWRENSVQYGGYRCYSKSPGSGPCSGAGSNELP